MQENRFILTPEIATRLVGTFYAYQQGLLDENNSILTKNDFFEILKKIAESRGWKTEPVSEIVTQLERIAFAPPDPNATIPGNLGELVSDYEEYLRKQGQPKSQNLQKELDLLRAKILESQKSFTQTEAPSSRPETTQEEKINPTPPQEENLVPEIPESRFTPQKDAPKKNTEEEQEIDIKPSEGIKFWIAQQRVEKLSRAVEGTQINKDLAALAASKIAESLQEARDQGTSIQESDLERMVTAAFENQPLAIALEDHSKQAIIENIKPFIRTEDPGILPFDINQTLTRPNLRTPSANPPEEKREEEKEKRQTNNTILVLYYQTPQWKKVFQEISPLSFFFGKRDDAKEYIEGALLRLQIEDPKFYSENITLIGTIRNNLNSILPSSEKIEKVQIINPEVPPLGRLIGASLLRLSVDPEKNTVNIEKLAVEQINSEVEKLRKKSPVSISNISSQAQQQVKKIGQNLLSSLAIKIRALFINPNLGWLRNSLAATFGVAGLVFPISLPLRMLLLGTSGSLFFAQLRFSSHLLSGTIFVVEKSVGVAQRSSDFFSKNVFSGSKIPMFGSAAAVVVPLVLGLGGFYGIIQMQSIFLPQKTSSGVDTQSAFIVLTKKVNPENYSASLPVEAKYSITIGAKEKSLKNISISDVFSVYGKGSLKSPISPSISFPSEIPAGKVESFEFSLSFGSEYQDSVVSNVITVKADVEGGPKGETITRSAAITIGNPPTGCFVFDGSWSGDYKASAQTAFAMLTRFPGYMASICKNSSYGPGVIVRYGGGKSYGGEVNGGNIMTLYDKAFDSRGYSCTFYTIVHESGHVLANKNPEILADFLRSVNPPNKEGYISSYTLGYSPGEDFAESVATYIKRSLGEYGCTGSYDNSRMESISPIHYNFWSRYIK